MQKKNVIAIILTTVIFLAAALLGVTSVYRVDSVSVEASLISKEAETEAALLRTRLEARYADESMFTVKRAAAEEETEAYAHFRLIGFEKDYPNRLIIRVAEDAEVFAVAFSDGYYILGADGTILGIRETPANRADGEDNVVVTDLSVSGEKGGMLTGDECLTPLLSVCRNLSAFFNGLRSNLTAVKVCKPTTSLSDAYFVLTMREGVSARFLDPTTKAEEKAGAFAETYLSLSAEQRLRGEIIVGEDRTQGKVFAHYVAERTE